MLPPKEANSWSRIQGASRAAFRFDAIIAGDGERAIFRAMEETGLIDADDPRSGKLWQTPADFNNAPWPSTPPSRR